MPEFWVSSGHHLTPRTEGGGLAITDELILAYLARPELVPPDEACAAERRLHASLMVSPRRAVVTEEIAAVVDPDARENWSVMLDFRERLLAAPSVEAAYLDTRAAPGRDAAAVSEPARAPHPAQRPRPLRGPLRPARRRAVLSPAAGLVSRRRGCCSPTPR